MRKFETLKKMGVEESVKKDCNKDFQKMFLSLEMEDDEAVLSFFNGYER